MPLQAWITLSLLVAMFAVMAWDKLPTWVVFLGAITIAMTFGLAPPFGLVKGFSNPAFLPLLRFSQSAAGCTRRGNLTLVAAFDRPA
jgi:hypothetical protein